MDPFQTSSDRVLQPKATRQPPHQGQLAALLQSRGYDSEDFFNSLDSTSISRSSSAPPAHILHPQQNGTNALGIDSMGTENIDDSVRQDPEYAAFYHNHARLDPRLPPPLYSPGQSWQVWGTPGSKSATNPHPGGSGATRRVSGGSAAIGSGVDFLAGTASASSSPLRANRELFDQEGNEDFFNRSGQGYSVWGNASNSVNVSPVGMRPSSTKPYGTPGATSTTSENFDSPRRKTQHGLMDMNMMQPSDFPRTPSPGFGGGRRLTGDGELNMRFKSAPASAVNTPARMNLQNDFFQGSNPAGHHEDEDAQRVMSVLSVALDSGRDDMLPAPITLADPLPRAASTPPSRFFSQFNGAGDGGDDGLNNGMNQLSLTGVQNLPGKHAWGSGPSQRARYPTNRSDVNDEFNSLTNGQHHRMGLDDYSNPMSRMDAYSINRPASAQGRFGPTSRFSAGPGATPPGFGNVSTQMANLAGAFHGGADPNAMAQALAVLSASGTLTPHQIQQLQMQIAVATANGGSPTLSNLPGSGTPGRGDSKRKVNLPLQTQSIRREYNNGAVYSPSSNGPMSAPLSGSRRPGDILGSPVPPESNRSAFLEDFRTNKNKKFELQDIVGNIVEFSGDQHGSRFIQQKLETASPEDRQLVFDEILPHVVRLMTDVFGNYVIQKFFEYGSTEQRCTLATYMKGEVLTLSLQMYGCRVVQKALEHLPLLQQVEIVNELEGNVLKCVKDQNGNHVIQKAIERIPADHIRSIIDSFHGHVYALATHPYGCRVIQRIFEHCSEEEARPLLEELHRYSMSLIQDQYGNYVIQHILEKGSAKDREFLVSKVRGQILTMSKHKFASNVVEKCVLFGSVKDRHEILEEIATTKSDGTTPLFMMMKDQFANYVVQKILDVASEDQKVMLVTKMKPQLPSLKKFTYGKHLISKVEKMIAQYNID